MTLCLIHRGDQVLLGMKKRGFGQGRWNGFGGKVHAGETILEAAGRELQEEAGVAVSELEEMGIIDFEFVGNEEILEVHIFRAQDFSGEPRESDEMRPVWHPQDKIPFAEMWPDDRYWFPYFLEGRKFRGRFLFDAQTNIVEQDLRLLETFAHHL